MQREGERKPDGEREREHEGGRKGERQQVHRHVSMVVCVIISKSAQFSNIKQSCCKKEECRERERESQMVRESTKEGGRERDSMCLYVCTHAWACFYVCVCLCICAMVAYVLKL